MLRFGARTSTLASRVATPRAFHAVTPLRVLAARPLRSFSGKSGSETVVDAEVQDVTDKPVDKDTFAEVEAELKAEMEAGAGAEAEAQEAKPEVFLEETESVVGEAETNTFQAETAKLLEIVAKSLYTDKEVFLRELISNAADALEKMRYFALAEQGGAETGDLQIRIAGDMDKKTLTIQDTGIGMTREELTNNLGTIARSGSLAFVKELEGAGDAAASGADSSSNIIGRFGVGFYSVFMVGRKVRVYSRSAKDEQGHCWSADGSGSYTVAAASGVERGTKIVIELNPESEMFASKNYIDSIVSKYSNFVTHDIFLNNEKCNKVEALWTKEKSSVTETEHTDFYRYISNSQDTPMFTLMYRADAPVEIKSLFYVPQMHTEKYGMGRMETGVNLYSRKVLITPKCKELLPEWLRFIKGAVDSEDIPLNISRESMQDSALMRKLSNVLTKRVLKWLNEESVRDEDKYAIFFKEFGTFLKEGCVTALAHKDNVSKLLRFESSAMDEGKLVSLEEYTKRMGSEQKQIYYICAPSRAIALSSPYYEAFKKKGVEVLMCHMTIDDFVMANLFEFEGKRLVSCDSSDAAVDIAAAEETEAEAAAGVTKLSAEESDALATWLKQTLSDKVSDVSVSDRLVDSPAVVMDHESAAMRRMMKMVEGSNPMSLPKQKLEINNKHPVMTGLSQIRYTHPDVASIVARQIFDNALIAADLLDDARTMMPRVNELMAELLKATSASAEAAPPAEAAPATEPAPDSAAKVVPGPYTLAGRGIN